MYTKVATLVTRLDDLSTGDKCQSTESNSEGFSWVRTSSNYFCLFENSRWFCFFSNLLRPSWSMINKKDSYSIKTVQVLLYSIWLTNFRAFIFLKYNKTKTYFYVAPFETYSIKVPHMVFTKKCNIKFYEKMFDR